MLTFDVSGSMAADDVEPDPARGGQGDGPRRSSTRRPQGVVIGVVAFSDAGLAVQEPTSDTAAVLDRDRPARADRGHLARPTGSSSTLDAIEASRAATPADYYSNRSPEPTEAPTRSSRAPTPRR